MRRETIFAIFFSLLVHMSVLLSITYIHFNNGEAPFGDPHGIIAVEVVGDNSSSRGVPRVIEGRRGDPVSATDSTGLLRSARNDIQGGKGGNSSFGSPTGNPILSKIRDKIMRSRRYPPEARRGKIEGRPIVTFQINPDGTLSSNEIKTSSGNALLDSAALTTIERAQPFPFYEHPITIAIRFSLSQE